MSIEIVEYHSIDGDTPTIRNFIVINGMPFYRSSGNNSGYPETWFPFFGIQEQDADKTPRGWLIKPKSDLYIPIKLGRTLNTLFQDKTLSYRFSSLPCMLISSLLGGGLWNEPKGIELKRLLLEKYPEFYAVWPTPVLSETNLRFEKAHLEQANRWLCEKAEVKNQSELNGKFPRTVSDLHLLKPIVVSSETSQPVLGQFILNNIADRASLNNHDDARLVSNARRLR